MGGNGQNLVVRGNLGGKNRHSGRIDLIALQIHPGQKGLLDQGLPDRPGIDMTEPAEKLAQPFAGAFLQGQGLV